MDARRCYEGCETSCFDEDGGESDDEDATSLEALADGSSCSKVQCASAESKLSSIAEFQHA
jgi:hypothetical protein